MCCHWLKERALCSKLPWNWAEAVTPSAKLYCVRPFPGLSLVFFFSVIESDISEEASQQIVTEEPNKVL